MDVVQISACRIVSGALVFVNSGALGHENSAPLSNRRMKEVEQVRRERLQELRERFGTLAALISGTARIRMPFNGAPAELWVRRQDLSD